MKKIYAPFFLVFMYSCISTSPRRISYLGSSYKITDHVDVFVDASAITQPYTVIGKGFPESVIMTKEKLQENAIRIAMEKGADAILFQDYYYSGEETSAYTLSHIDSTAKTLTATRRNVYPSESNVQIRVLFLKYK